MTFDFSFFIKFFPEIISVSARSPLGIIALALLLGALVLLFLYGRERGIFRFILTLVFILGLFGTAYQMSIAYQQVKEEKAEKFGPGEFSLESATTWSGENVIVRPGTIIKTNGFDFKIEAAAGDVTFQGTGSTILSYRRDQLPADQAKPVATTQGSPNGGAAGGECNNGANGGEGGAGVVGLEGNSGGGAGKIEIVASNAIVGTVDIVNVGMTGGRGGDGGDGGIGGAGQRGSVGKRNRKLGIDVGCGCGAGFGGAGGRGGAAGDGGMGGSGGAGGQVIVRALDTSGFNVGANIKGGQGGDGGDPGRPGDGGGLGLGGGGNGPFCRDESQSRQGAPGQRGSTGLKGSQGPSGVDGSVKIQPVRDIRPL